MWLSSLRTISAFAVLAFGLSACEEGAGFLQGAGSGPDATEASEPAPKTTQSVTGETWDVDAPEIFQVTDTGLWDGRPSLGGDWIAHPSVKDPQRVRILNESNGKAITAALFRRERDNPGPVFQVSSDAAQKLGMLAGETIKLSVVALRKEEIAPPPPPPPVPQEVASEAVPEAEIAPSDAAVPTIETDTVDPVAVATAAIENSQAATDGAIDATTTAAAATTAVAPEPVSRLKKPYIQIGIYGEKSNADVVAETLSEGGLEPNVVEQSSESKTIYRVIVGPARNLAERISLARKVRKLGYRDAYFTAE